MKVETRAVGGDRIDSLSMQLDPVHLLNAWSGWTAQIKKDLEARSEPIDLIPVVDDAMACVERIMKAILVTESADMTGAAQLIIDAVNRLPGDALENSAVPMLFEAEVDGGNIQKLSPTPLPVADSLAMIAPPRQ
jgi:hypothetical protein